MKKPLTDPSSPATDPSDRYRAPALDKGLDILELLARQPQGLTRSEIVAAMARSPGEIYRMLERLVARQYVQRSEGGDRFALSLKLYALAHMHPPLNRLITQALPVMDAFARQAEQSCHMAQYDRGDMLIVAQVNGPSAWGMSIRLGARVGLADTASGQMWLAFSDPERVPHMLAEHSAQEGEVPLPPNELPRRLAAIARAGHIQRDSLQSHGVIDLSCPLLGPDGHALAVLTCPYIRRIDRHIGPSPDAVLEMLKAAAGKLSFVAAG
ncbi:IclR family transcriptional regulator [Amphibiibacter pelophylacis]|uniref:IclR family transcriptional regulator n=1 Tax=Amphibiibacter pelophylacis TaxID=1799477 RepID=A0ACC6P204_9BURK